MKKTTEISVVEEVKTVSSFGAAAVESAEISSTELDGTETSTTIQVSLTGRKDTIQVTYDLGEITPRLRKSISNLGDADEDKAEGAMIDLVSKIVVDWNYTTRKGVEVGTSAEDISDHVSIRDLSSIVSGIFAGAASPNDSGAGN